MISNQILQNTIEGLKGITRIDFCVMDTDGKSLASTFSEQENYVEEVISFVESPADSQVVQGYQFFALIHSVTLNFGQKYNNLCRLLEKYYGNFSLIRNIIVTLRCF